MHDAPEIGRFAWHGGLAPQYGNFRMIVIKVGISIYPVVPFQTTDEHNM